MIELERLVEQAQEADTAMRAAIAEMNANRQLPEWSPQRLTEEALARRQQDAIAHRAAARDAIRARGQELIAAERRSLQRQLDRADADLTHEQRERRAQADALAAQRIRSALDRGTEPWELAHRAVELADEPTLRMLAEEAKWFPDELTIDEATARAYGFPPQPTSREQLIEFIDNALTDRAPEGHPRRRLRALGQAAVWFDSQLEGGLAGAYGAAFSGYKPAGLSA